MAPPLSAAPIFSPMIVVAGKAMPPKFVVHRRQQFALSSSTSSFFVSSVSPSFCPFQFQRSSFLSTSASSSPPFCPLQRSFLSSSNSSFASSSSSLPSSVPSLDELKRNNAAQIKQLSAAITEFCADSFERNKQLRERTRPFVARLESAVCAPKSRARLVLIGSVASGMAFDEASTDIDVAFVYIGKSARDQEKFLQAFWTSSFCFVSSFLEAIAETVKDYFNTHSTTEYHMSKAPEIISHIFVPLIVANLDNGTRLDISFPRLDFQSLRNTLMVRYYIQADRRFLFLFHWLRAVFIEMGLKNSKCGLFSSYHTLLLVLHFLNRKEVPNNVLPAFSELPQQIRDKLFEQNVGNIVQQLEEMPTTETVTEPFWTSKCTKSVGELAVELVDYYACFDPLTTAISIQHGRTTEVFRHPLSNNNARPWLKVMDPFLQMSSTRSSLLGEALVVGFQFLHDQMAAGNYLTTFPMLDGLNAQFGDHVRSHGFSWAMFLDKNYVLPLQSSSTAATRTTTASDKLAPAAKAMTVDEQEEDGAENDDDDVDGDHDQLQQHGGAVTEPTTTTPKCGRDG